jgi:peptidylglycine monooxygenase
MHHMLMYGCALPGSEEEAWDCGEMHNGDGQNEQYQQGPVCADGAQIIYAWARDAPQLTLPKDVGFLVGGKTKIHHLVVQIHYMHPMTEPDYSGITLYSTKTPMPKSAGTALLVTGGKIPARSTEKFETACLVDEDVELHPFAFRTHTHQLGKVVSGYVIQDGQWKLIGKRNPQDPQMFYPVKNRDLVVRKNDILAARCTLTNKSDRDVEVGPTGNDEMCNFYMMYWVEGQNTLSDNTCFSPGPPNYYWGKQGGLTNIPDTAASML